MLNASFRNQILDIIKKNSSYRYEDFILEEKDKKEDYYGNFTILSIKYRFNESYYYKIKVPAKKSETSGGSLKFTFQVNYCPGELSKDEESRFENKQQIFDQLIEWTKLLSNELLNFGVYKILNDKLKNQQDLLSDFEEKIKDMDDDYISKEESIELKKRLDELEKKFKDQFNNQLEKTKEVEDELKKITEEIKLLKGTMDVLKKKKWFSMLFCKLISWSNEPNNKPVINAATKIIKAALPNEVKQLIPESDDIK